MTYIQIYTIYRFCTSSSGTSPHSLLSPIKIYNVPERGHPSVCPLTWLYTYIYIYIYKGVSSKSGARNPEPDKTGLGRKILGAGSRKVSVYIHTFLEPTCTPTVWSPAPHCSVCILYTYMCGIWDHFIHCNVEPGSRLCRFTFAGIDWIFSIYIGGIYT